MHVWLATPLSHPLAPTDSAAVRGVVVGCRGRNGGAVRAANRHIREAAAVPWGAHGGCVQHGTAGKAAGCAIQRSAAGAIERPTSRAAERCTCPGMLHSSIDTTHSYTGVRATAPTLFQMHSSTRWTVVAGTFVEAQVQI